MQVDKTARRQLVIMRWHHARAVLACEHKQSLMKLPSAKSHGVLQQVCVLWWSLYASLHAQLRGPNWW